MESKKKNFNSQQRMLDLFWRLFHGESIALEQAALEYSVSPLTIKGDIAKIRAVIDHYNLYLLYDPNENVYRLDTENQVYGIEDVFVFLIMLYDSRSLPKHELTVLAEKMIKLLSAEKQKQIYHLIRSYDFYYVANQHSSLLPHIQLVLRAILEQKILLIKYHKIGEIKERKVAPLTLSYHRGAFYMTALLVDTHVDTPIHFRLDRMKECELLDRKFYREMGQHYFKAGEYKNQSVNMFIGDVTKIKIKVASWLEEYVLRDFPTAKKVDAQDGHIIMEVEALGVDGILYWILAQQDRVEVLYPISLRDEIKKRLSKMMELYSNPV